MEMLRSYVLSVVCAALVCGVLADLSEKTGFAKPLRLVCSIFMAYTLVSPLIRLRFPGWEVRNNCYWADAKSAAARGENLHALSIAAIIRQETEAYILKEAKSIGANLEVKVELSTGDPPVPAAVTLQGDFDASVEVQLGRLLADELGIPKEHQTWIRQSPPSSDNSSPNTSMFF